MAGDEESMLVGTWKRLIAVDGQPLESASAFVDKIEEHQPGERIVLTVLRDGQQVQIPVMLGESSS